MIDCLYVSISDSLSLHVLYLQYGEENSKSMGKCREPDYAGQYSPWSCETIGSYIGTKDAKPKDVMVPGTMEMMVSSDGYLFEPCQYFSYTHQEWQICSSGFSIAWWFISLLLSGRMLRLRVWGNHRLRHLVGVQKSRTMTLSSHLAPSPLYHALVQSPAPQRQAIRLLALYRPWLPLSRIQTLNTWPCQVKDNVHINDSVVSYADLAVK